MNSNRKNFFSALGGLALAPWLALAATPTGSDDEALQMSPFTVQSEKDNGYAATSTLAGTRLRTDLRDVGAAISVITRDFMEDISATNAEELLVYTLGTEASGLRGNFSGAEISTLADFQGQLTNVSGSGAGRVRGLQSPDVARNFFLTSIPFDSYNTDRVTVNRGPNATMFGLGSPAGVLDATLAVPTFRDAATIQFKFDRWGGTRASLDVDRVLIPGKLALRVAGLYKNNLYEQDFAFQRDRRAYVSAIGRPWQNTTIRANAEIGGIRANRPRVDPPRDLLTTWWTDTNQVTWNTVTGGGFPRRPFGNVLATPGNWYTNPALIFSDPQNTQLANGPTGNGFVAISNLLATQPAFLGMNTLGAIKITQGDPEASFWSASQITDRSIFDYRKVLLEGPNNRQFSDFKVANVALEQRVLDGAAGFEIAYSRETWRDGSSTLANGASGYGIEVDFNLVYPDGQPNPNFGRPYFASRSGAARGWNDRQDFRATAFYAFDFRRHLKSKWAAVAGKHTVTALYDDYETTVQRRGYVDGRIEDATYRANVGTTDALNSVLGVGTVSYLGPSLANLASPAGANIGGITSLRRLPDSAVITYGTRLPVTAQNRLERGTFSLVTLENGFDRLVTSASKSRTEVASKAAIWESRFLEDKLIGIVSWREDRAAGFVGGGIDPATGDFVTTPRRNADNSLRLGGADYFFNSDPTSNDSAKTTSYSVVGHLPDAIKRRLPLRADASLHYVESQNFQPVGGRFDVLGEKIGSPAGTTRESGFTLSLFNSKFVLRASRYETNQANVTDARLGSAIKQTLNAVQSVYAFNTQAQIQQANFKLPPQAMLDLYGWVVTPAANGFASGQYATRSDVAATTQMQAKGLEFEAVFNPTNQWRFSLNAARQESIRTNSGGVFGTVVNTLAQSWAREGSAGALKQSPTNTLGNFFANQIFNPYYTAALSDGSATQELRKWRFNAVGNHTFEGWLKGWRVGGAVRWQSKEAIGYGTMIYPTGVRGVDLNHAYYGPEDLKVDAWVGYRRKFARPRSIDWSVQLNARNLTEDGKLVPVVAQPDGSIAAFRIGEGISWEVTNTFRF